MSNIVFDETSQKYRNLITKNSGNLQVDIISGGGGGGGGGDASAGNQTTQIGNQTTMITELTQIESEIQVVGTNQTNGNQQAKCMGIDGTGTPQQLLLESNGSLIVGGGNIKVSVDGAGTTTHILTDTAGKILTSSVGDTGVLASIQTDTTNTANTLNNGTQISKCFGSEDPTNATATQRQIHIDGSGNIQTNVVNTINVAPANTLNSGITNDPANSIAVGLRGRTTIADATTETFLKCDANGVQDVATIGIDSGGVLRQLKVDGTGNLVVDLLNDSSTEYTDGSALPANPVGGVIMGENDSGNGEVIKSTNNALNFSLRETGITTTGINVNVPTGGLYTSAGVNIKSVPRGIIFANYADSSASILWEWSVDDVYYTNDVSGFLTFPNTTLTKDSNDPTKNYIEFTFPFSFIRFKITNSTGSDQALALNIYSKSGAGY